MSWEGKRVNGKEFRHFRKTLGITGIGIRKKKKGKQKQKNERKQQRLGQIKETLHSCHQQKVESQDKQKTKNKNIGR